MPTIQSQIIHHHHTFGLNIVYLFFALFTMHWVSAWDGASYLGQSPEVSTLPSVLKQHGWREGWDEGWVKPGDMGTSNLKDKFTKEDIGSDVSTWMHMDTSLNGFLFELFHIPGLPSTSTKVSMAIWSHPSSPGPARFCVKKIEWCAKLDAPLSGSELHCCDGFYFKRLCWHFLLSSLSEGSKG